MHQAVFVSYLIINFKQVLKTPQITSHISVVCMIKRKKSCKEFKSLIMHYKLFNHVIFNSQYQIDLKIEQFDSKYRLQSSK